MTYRLKIKPYRSRFVILRMRSKSRVKIEMGEDVHWILQGKNVKMKCWKIIIFLQKI